ncbi:hypothetical protein BJ742DRAFT_771799 [Cladochytrium replicatum]|nr:hypothetical protein BJ742DRAFT_771799 [Cladochytrium replicatum]
MERLKGQAEIEAIAESILTDRQLIVDLDRRRNSYREAISTLRKQEKEASSGTPPASGKVWFLSDTLFVKTPRASAMAQIEEGLKRIDEEISEARKRIKSQAIELEQLENRD